MKFIWNISRISQTNPWYTSSINQNHFSCIEWKIENGKDESFTIIAWLIVFQVLKSFTLTSQSKEARAECPIYGPFVAPLINLYFGKINIYNANIHLQKEIRSLCNSSGKYATFQLALRILIRFKLSKKMIRL